MDRNRPAPRHRSRAAGSLSARRAWIEIATSLTWSAGNWVALRKESVDRNPADMPVKDYPAVALRKESVDRNATAWTTRRWPNMSLSARRAWIEIRPGTQSRLAGPVALRKESVDRNFIICRRQAHRPRSLSARRAWIEMSASWMVSTAGASLSARRAWIEIPPRYSLTLRAAVALRKESVDRNLYFTENSRYHKSVALRKESVDRNTRQVCLTCRVDLSLSARRAWIEIRATETGKMP